MKGNCHLKEGSECPDIGEMKDDSVIWHISEVIPAIEVSNDANRGRQVPLKQCDVLLSLTSHNEDQLLHLGGWVKLSVKQYVVTREGG